MESNSTLKNKAEQSREILGAKIQDGHELRHHLLTLLEYIDSLKARCYSLEGYSRTLEIGLEKREEL